MKVINPLSSAAIAELCLTAEPRSKNSFLNYGFSKRINDLELKSKQQAAVIMKLCKDEVLY